MIVTSNKPFEQWAEMFVDPILANAALDRLIHHAHVVPIAGESYHKKDRRPPPQPPAGKGTRTAKRSAERRTNRDDKGASLLIYERGFVGAGALSPSAQLKSRDQRRVGVVSASPQSKPAKVYNLEVDNFHTYFVGESAVWVHNVKQSDPGRQ